MEDKAKIIIVGGGVAALEAATGLHDSPNIDADVALVTPSESFVYRPYQALEPFGLRLRGEMPVADLLEGTGTRLIHDRVSSFEPRNNRVVLRGGHTEAYDAALITTGAEPLEAVFGAVTIGMPDANRRFEFILNRISAGRVGSIAFVVPPGASWTLPSYEFALLTAARMRRHALDGTRVRLITPETRPLAAFGEEVSELVRRSLDDAEVALHTSARASRFIDNAVELATGESVYADECVAMPTLIGRRIQGLPHDDNGFLPVDRHGHVADTGNIYAAGDITDFPLKQGGIAAQQADAVVQSLAVRFGDQESALPFRPELRAMMIGGPMDHFTRRLAGPDSAGSTSIGAEAFWADGEKIFTRHLAQRLQRVRGADLRLAAR